METTRVIIQSPYDDVELAQVPLHAFVLDGAAARAAQPTLIDGATSLVLSYRELAESVRKAAAGLVAHGVAKGDVLALRSPNCPEFVVAYLAALTAGAVAPSIRWHRPATSSAS
jgi:acyl-CoA synthetase (AMP-forming)/AMP-acid ligase II